jgi:hypothetical protein
MQGMKDLPASPQGQDGTDPSPGLWVPDPEPTGWSETRKRFLEDLRSLGGAATIPRCPPDITVEKVQEGFPLVLKLLREASRAVRRKDCPPGVELDDALATLREFEKIARESVSRLKRVAYDGKRGDRPSGQRIDARPVGGHFVVVDSEGVVLGRKKVAATKTHGNETHVAQRTCLWMAGGAEGYQDQMLEDVSGNGLSLVEIFEFLLSLPRKFASPDPGAKQPIFVGFGFCSYDTGQIVADLPNKNVWEFHTRKKWYRRERGLPNEPSLQGVTLHGPYAVSGKARKYIRIYRLRNPNKWWKEDKNGRKTVDWIEKIEIFDVIGFFQSSLLKAIKHFPGLVTKEELEILKRGKAGRGRVTKENVAAKMPELKVYTAKELQKTARMMELVRLTFETAVPGRPRLKKWWGGGAVGGTILEQQLGKPRDARAKLGDIETPLVALEEEGRRPLMWALRAFFGGRGELMKQGLTGDVLHVYDLSSAYPAQIAELPSMEGGKWVYRKNPTREEIEQSCVLSMLLAETHNFNYFLPFYPLPSRVKGGAIMFPASVRGVWMRDDVVAAFKYFDKFSSLGRLSHGVPGGSKPEIRVTEALFFVPATDERPFAFIRELFDLRARIMKADKNDVRAIILKLAYNSIYGKLAQSVGRKGEPPPYASPWMAAAITAGTRRKLIEAALTAPDSIVCVATDGMVATEELDVFLPKEKTLGLWEHEVAKGGGVFAQSGVYALMKDLTKADYDRMEDREKVDEGVKIAARGFSPLGPDDDVTRHMVKVLFENIPACWKEGKPAYVFDRQQYVTVGAALARNPPPPIVGSGKRRAWGPLLTGSWIESEGKLQLDAMSRKRLPPKDPLEGLDRASGLVALAVNHWPPYGGKLDSYPARPKWMDPKWFGPEWSDGEPAPDEEGVEKDFEWENELELDEQEDVIAGLSAG